MADDTTTISIADVGEKGSRFLLNHSDPAGTPRPDVWRQAVADFFQLDLDAEVLWTPIGPAPIIVATLIATAPRKPTPRIMGGAFGAGFGNPATLAAPCERDVDVAGIAGHAAR